jgi:hypothetical protein
MLDVENCQCGGRGVQAFPTVFSKNSGRKMRHVPEAGGTGYENGDAGEQLCQLGALSCVAYYGIAYGSLS